MSDDEKSLLDLIGAFHEEQERLGPKEPLRLVENTRMKTAMDLTANATFQEYLQIKKAFEASNYIEDVLGHTYDGDSLNFLMDVYNISFRDAFAYMAFRLAELDMKSRSS